MAALSLPISASPALIQVAANDNVVDALLDTGASVTVVNKNFVQSLGLKIAHQRSGSIVVANNAEMEVRGLVEIRLTIARVSLLLHALYIPDITYGLIIGTNVLRHIGTKIIANNQVLWPKPGTLPRSSGELNFITADDAKPLMVTTEHVVIPPLSGMFVSGKIKNSRESGNFERKLNKGSVPYQVVEVQNGETCLFIANASQKQSLLIPANAAVAYANSDVKIWRNKDGEILTLDLVNKITVDALSNASENDTHVSHTVEKPAKDRLNRKQRRAAERLEK